MKDPQERYTYKPFEGSSHLWALSYLNRLPTSARVLDVGPGSCIMGKELRARGLTELFAVEADASAREFAGGIYQQAEATLAAFQNMRFDAILLLDVLEHMPKPEEFFIQVTALLNPGGLVLISLPNVAHWSVRLQLLFGFFEYTERGILDRTHLHFFTKRRVKSLLGLNQELKTTEFTGSLTPVEMVLPRRLWDNLCFRAFSRFRKLLVGAAPGLLAYQHLVALKFQGQTKHA